MTDTELADFLRRRYQGRDVVYSAQALPEPNLSHSTVTLYTDQLKRFRDNLAELQVFAAQVCGVPVEELCLMDMWAFLMKRQGVSVSHLMEDL